MIRLFIADEQPVVLSGLRAFFRGSEFQIVGEATNGLELVHGIERTGPHLVLIDTQQTSFHGFFESFHWKVKIIEFTTSLKSASKQRLLEHLRTVVPKCHVSTCRTNGLTPREVEILRQIVQGHCNKEIARILSISVETVKEHVQNILRKTSLSDRTQAALWAVQQEIASL